MEWGTRHFFMADKVRFLSDRDANLKYGAIQSMHLLYRRNLCRQGFRF
jgi:hypothetical protein